MCVSLELYPHFSILRNSTISKSKMKLIWIATLIASLNSISAVVSRVGREWVKGVGWLRFGSLEAIGDKYSIGSEVGGRIAIGDTHTWLGFDHVPDTYVTSTSGQWATSNDGYVWLGLTPEEIGENEAFLKSVTAILEKSSEDSVASTEVSTPYEIIAPDGKHYNVSNLYYRVANGATVEFVEEVTTASVTTEGGLSEDAEPPRDPYTIIGKDGQLYKVPTLFYIVPDGGKVDFVNGV
eukprot:Blabericola_migrator_1__8423@NODE_438_length_8472_cov_502_790006_g344_i0_p3_GENE_NODE_438_length_8472_cov_502_790006_g344_i0NODE_438_length_8472_cov_502_790006_g344_i0_p3_ORF_typecomplete_len238_score42_43_NODE_438_length_8472_cov_502_790006_g344_i010581771